MPQPRKNVAAGSCGEETHGPRRPPACRGRSRARRTLSRGQTVVAGRETATRPRTSRSFFRVSVPALLGRGGLDPRILQSTPPSRTRSTAPPSAVEVLRVPKLYMETSAAGSPILLGPWKACAQSSTRCRPRSLANFAIPPRSMRPPNRCATRTTACAASGQPRASRAAARASQGRCPQVPPVDRAPVLCGS